MNAIRRENFRWLQEAAKCPQQTVILQLGEAFRSFFAGLAKCPTFRGEGRHDRFALDKTEFSVDGSRLRIFPARGLRVRESLRFSGKTLSAAISRVADPPAGEPHCRHPGQSSSAQG